MPEMENLAATLGRLSVSCPYPTAYDTAWGAEVGDTNTSTARWPESLQWLRRHQHPDGSWGGSSRYAPDRLICTLRSVLTLTKWHHPEDLDRTEAGWAYLQTHPLSESDPQELIGLEVLYPSLVAQATSLGRVVPNLPAALVAAGSAKLATVPKAMLYCRSSPLIISLEGLHPIPKEVLPLVQESNGSVGISPAATAYLLSVSPHNAAADAYLRRILAITPVAGGLPAFWPVELFETAWSLFLLGAMRPDLLTRWAPNVRPLLDMLRSAQTPTGWCTSSEHSIPEPDSSGIILAILGQAGDSLDFGLLDSYEAPDHFRCYRWERNPSVSANAHILSALRYDTSACRKPRQAKILRFLAQCRNSDGFWRDKWHISPFYATSQVVLAAHSIAPELVAPALHWIRGQQHSNGSWGVGGGTIEETAYALIALQAVEAKVGNFAIQAGQHYLRSRPTPQGWQYPALWIGKSLYVPIRVVEAAVQAALWGASSYSDCLSAYVLPLQAMV